MPMWSLLASPILGELFKSRSKRAEQTELMVLITPRLVRALDPDEVPPLPTTPDSFIKKPGEVGDRLEGGAGLVDPPPRGNTTGPGKP